MADYCKQCSETMFGKDFGDFAGMITEEKAKKGFGAIALCEGCGNILVNHGGKRISEPEIKDPTSGGVKRKDSFHLFANAREEWMKKNFPETPWVEHRF